MGQDVLVDRRGAVAWVTLNRPDARNSVNQQMRDDLDRIFAELAVDASVRVVVLTGAGTAFCAGSDLTAASAGPAETQQRLVAAVDGFPGPVIAAVNGGAAGGGFEFALAADIRVASPHAKFLLPELRLGSLPGSGGTQRIFQALPSAVAWKLLLTGQPMSAEEALRWGLVTDVFPVEGFESSVQALAERIAEAAPLSVRAAKAAGRAALDHPDGWETERRLWVELAQTEDRQEGRAAFREKRTPRFTGR